MFENERGGILITHEMEERVREIEESRHPLRCVTFMRDDFKIEDAKEVICEAYKSEENTKTLILGAKSFTVPAQNALLKILEEPPRNIVFILLAPNKSTFLPTVRSRLSLKQEHTERLYETLPVTLKSLDLAGLFAFVKENDRLKKHEAKALIEQLMHQAIHLENLPLSASQLEGFDKALRLIELNSRFQSVLVMVLMNFIREVKRGR
ncbi:putative DNA polymerase III delta prime subunit HolB [Sulfuricurvum kujiense DSM 16994]|uniref:DNA polymerase III delta prime subunit HolB n=1 Tax=Sulfuricurvum kujiense (strain ATCC BAA-921 / DSM 16994 / JCM 11577 / YK-1) TaxID=709032 RepID=E4U0P4_SULKY|nr:DNA polymerase III subunit delta' [Sulfuricurvum kujiense]ADR33270.1 putative DNA polymerase III delta prime subunit HolB [Sulfuricurvum kujiense DSM 16994]